MILDFDAVRSELKSGLPRFLSGVNAALPVEREEVDLARQDQDYWFLVSSLVGFLKMAFSWQLVTGNHLDTRGLESVLVTALTSVEGKDPLTYEHQALHADLIDAGLAVSIVGGGCNLSAQIVHLAQEVSSSVGAENLLDVSCVPGRLLRFAVLEKWWDGDASFLNAVDVTEFSEDPTEQLLRYTIALYKFKETEHNIWKRGAEAWLSVISTWWLLGAVRRDSTLPSFRLILARALAERLGLQVPSLPLDERIVDNLEGQFATLSRLGT